MANIKSAVKRIEVTKRQTLKNKSKKSEIKTYIKKFHAAISKSNLESANELLRTIDKKLKKASTKSVLHKNAASRKVSNLSKKLHQASVVEA